jgi:hypothetical protein
MKEWMTFNQPLAFAKSVAGSFGSNMTSHLLKANSGRCIGMSAETATACVLKGGMVNIEKNGNRKVECTTNGSSTDTKIRSGARGTTIVSERRQQSCVNVSLMDMVLCVHVVEKMDRVSLPLTMFITTGTHTVKTAHALDGTCTSGYSETNSPRHSRFSVSTATLGKRITKASAHISLSTVQRLSRKGVQPKRLRLEAHCTRDMHTDDDIACSA